MGETLAVFSESLRMGRCKPSTFGVVVSSLIRFRLAHAHNILSRLLPDWAPVHPWRWWVHCRVVYLPTSYLYANKCKMPLNTLLKDLRQEIYAQPYSSINFANHCNTVAQPDMKRAPTLFVKIINSALRFWEINLRSNWIHAQANASILALIRREDENTSYNNLAPVDKALHMVVIYFVYGKYSNTLARHQEKVSSYLWQSANGLTSGVTNGVQLWDTAFSVIAAAEAGLAKRPEFRESMENALQFLDHSQFRDDLADPYRQKRKGGWPFSTKDNSYIVSDSSAEGMKAVLLLQEK